MNIEQLKKDMIAALAQAKAALEGDTPDVAKAAEFRSEAERIKSVIKSYEDIEAMIGDVAAAQNQRPPVPTTKAATGFVPLGPAPETNGNQTNDTDTVLKGIYQMQFGDTSKAVEQILKELYPAVAERAWNVQKSAFGRYLRKGDKALTSEDQSALKSIVLTPQMVADTVVKGFDQVGFLKATLVEAIDTLGGYAVPIDFQAKVIQRIAGATVVRGRAQVNSTSRDMVEMPTIAYNDTNDQYTSAVRVSWVEETPTSPGATNFTLGMENIPIHTSMAETYMSRNLIEDSAFDLEGWLSQKLGEAAGIDEDNRFLIGSGVGNPVGILPVGSNTNGLTERASGGASTITWDGLISMIYSVPKQYRDGAVWIANRFTYEAIMKLKTGDEYLWRPFQFTGGTEGQPAPLLGFPTLEQEIMPDIAASAYPLLFGSLQAYQIFDRVGMTIERYLDSGTARNNQVLFVMRRRLGGKPLETWRMSTMKVAASL